MYHLMDLSLLQRWPQQPLVGLGYVPRDVARVRKRIVPVKMAPYDFQQTTHR